MSCGCPGMLKCSQTLASQLPLLIRYLELLQVFKKWNSTLKCQVNKASFVNKGIVKTCRIVDMIRKNWSCIAVAGCGLNYFILAPFGLSWVVANFIAAKNFTYLFFTAMKIHTMACIVKKQNNFIFVWLVT